MRLQQSHDDVAEMDGGCAPLKVLMSGRCLHDCGYCPNSVASGGGRHRGSSPGEVVDSFFRMRREGFRGGLFLSSTALRRRPV